MFSGMSFCSRGYEGFVSVGVIVYGEWDLLGAGGVQFGRFRAWWIAEGRRELPRTTCASVLISRMLCENEVFKLGLGGVSFGVAKRLEIGKFYDFVLKVFNCVTE